MFEKCIAKEFLSIDFFVLARYPKLWSFYNIIISMEIFPMYIANISKYCH